MNLEEILGVVKITYNDIHSGYGCKKCANEKRKYTQKEAILKLNSSNYSYKAYLLEKYVHEGENNG